MLRFGIVTNINEKECRARVQFDSDELSSHWLFVLQAKTQKDKFYFMPDIGEHVACLMDERCEEGVILGAIYSDLDEVPVISKDKFKIRFNDGAEIEYDRKEHVLNIVSQRINVQGLIYHRGVLINNNGIVSESDINDHTSSMQTMRDIYNSHTHNETDSVTGNPSEEMG